MYTVAVITANKVLTLLQQRNAFRQLGYTSRPTDDTVVSEDDCLRLWLIMLLKQLEFLAPEQRTAIFDAITDSLTGRGVELALAIHKKQESKSPLLVIADGRYVTWTNYTGWLDLVTGEPVQAPEQPPLETVAYNLAVLFGRNALACQKLQRRLDDADGKK